MAARLCPYAGTYRYRRHQSDRHCRALSQCDDDGLRNLTGIVDGNGRVTLWATTSTSSASGDNGADPNKVVRISADVAATTMTGRVMHESFETVAGPTYGTVYRGVAYVD